MGRLEGIGRRRLRRPRRAGERAGGGRRPLDGRRAGRGRSRRPPRRGRAGGVNPLVDPPAPSFQSLLGELLAAGERFLPGIGGDISDPDAGETAYDRLPVAALRSMGEGLADLRPRLGEIRCPVLILTSRRDHVVPTVSSDVLAAAVSGPVERVWLERSFHVATLDVERAEVERRVVAFARRVTSL